MINTILFPIFLSISSFASDPNLNSSNKSMVVADSCTPFSNPCNGQVVQANLQSKHSPLVSNQEQTGTPPNKKDSHVGGQK
jgi:hypothetical protein